MRSSKPNLEIVSYMHHCFTVGSLALACDEACCACMLHVTVEARDVARFSVETCAPEHISVCPGTEARPNT